MLNIEAVGYIIDDAISAEVLGNYLLPWLVDYRAQQGQCGISFASCNDFVECITWHLIFCGKKMFRKYDESLRIVYRLYMDIILDEGPTDIWMFIHGLYND